MPPSQAPKDTPEQHYPHASLTMPPPLPANDLQVVSIDSLEAALAKLAIKISVNDIVSVIREEEEAKRVKLIARASERRATLSNLALNPLEQPSGLQFTTTSKFIADPPKPAKADPLAKERRRRLLDLTEQTFPDGKVPDPVVTSAEDQTDNPPQSVFENVWCLWDTGAQTSFVVTHLLDSVVRNNQDEGSAIMEISFQGVNQRVDSIIHFRPTLPNGVTFIILGQHALLNRLQYQIQPTSICPQLSQIFPQAYGQIDLVSWCDPLGDEVVPL
ncbi:hypothetical protein SCP_0602760 [Sparassis crispa]|uniref:Uncharacterized protein n=1 Tax=Sparassis crispa TaxID=139825 RepID=A0A401GQ05_9APHY|nr:hypothetical protein SCP_0602760 [Sparassis crispa]GBE84298.1 hypothetical protein SCP_0602760 [Sparassis crispa]